MKLVKIQIINSKTQKETEIELNPDGVRILFSEIIVKPNSDGLTGPNNEAITDEIMVSAIALDTGQILFSPESREDLSSKLQGY